MKNLSVYFSRRVILLMILVLIGASASMAKTFNFQGHLVKNVEVMLGGDWALHAVLAFALGFLACWAAPKHHFERGFFHFPPLLVLMFAFVCIDEGLQAFSPLRAFSWWDLLINVVGLLFGSIVYRLNLRCRGC